MLVFTPIASGTPGRGGNNVVTTARGRQYWITIVTTVHATHYWMVLYMLMERGVSVCAPRHTLEICQPKHSLSLCKIYFSNALTNRSSRLYPKAPLAFTALSRCFIAFPPQRTPAVSLAPLATAALLRSFTRETLHNARYLVHTLGVQ
jgi:hypothetical protein